MWHFLELETARKIPSLPIYIDSPMATSVSMLYCQHLEEHDLDLLALTAREGCMFESRRFQYVTDVEDSKQLNRMPGPAIIISASGMATGGRILHHLKHRLPDRKNTVLLVGFQAAGTRGRLLQDEAKSIRIHGQDVQVKAKIASIGGLSAHADHGELMRWLERLQAPPKKTYTVHGEPEACENLAAALRQKGWDAEMALDGGVVPIG
jgi:metallo-beta-lactamase family protein